jgi:hypothetical protein
VNRKQPGGSQNREDVEGLLVVWGKNEP